MVSGVRERLVDGGIRLLERDGLQSLSVRNLAAEVGTSTMAVYTHFGGMTGVIDAVANEAFSRFTQALTDVPQTDDPVADFFVMGAAYRAFALANPQRYQLIFGTSSPASIAGDRTDVTSSGGVTDRTDSAASFDALLNAVRRMIAAGRIRDDGELNIAGRLWSLTHGEVMLELAGFFGHEGQGLNQILAPLAVDTIVGMGDHREKTLESLAAARH
ncbi:TetR family transcriptional regulator [Mycobacterium antarcticum]|uniref:TetR/AcrR family transcriptional regulator n=1 Tax=Mycolicibacterium sp. TUM20985 TaxID=3023370 RepID=UPI00257407A3|nr:TetR/AcrR family transcriptional regulator [Mycolicibacterium sp. TUM20985]BDX35140.1 TetR family transcriptional regulator [Mycolicibacterium sp. TUM20985]